jgi:cytochrome P450
VQRHPAFAGRAAPLNPAAKSIHRCIGPQLALTNLRIALETFLKRVPDYRVRDGVQARYLGGITRSLTTLPIVFDPSR